MIAAKLLHSARAFWSGAEGDRGLMAPLFALALVVLVGMAGTALDVGRVMMVKRQLQASADAAVLAGAQNVAYDTTKAKAAALEYSGVTGKKNAVVGAKSVAIVGGAAVVTCAASVKPTCAGTTTGNNVIKVTQEAVVPMYFLRVVGMNNMTPRASATASARGGSGRSLDVVIVIDTTASMDSADANCGISKAKRITCARAGAYAMMQGLNPALDQISLMTFPGLTASGVKSNTECNAPALDKNRDLATYNEIGTGVAGTTYSLFGLTNSFGLSNGSGLDTNSAAVIAAGGSGNSNCRGFQAVGGMGTYFADVIDKAKDALVASSRPNSQKVIVVLSDGDATADEFINREVTDAKGKKSTVQVRNMASDKVANQCQRAIASARAARDQGIWVYSVAYGATTSTSDCAKDTTQYPGITDVLVKNISPCVTMKYVASETSKFYSDNANGCAGVGGNSSNLVTLFQNISSDLTMPRLIPNSTT